MTGSAGRPIRVCLQLAQYDADYGTIRRAAADAEAAGVDALFNWDHFFGPGRDSAARHFECWTMLAALAESTTSVDIGPLVTCTAYRNADLVADMARTVDHISGGRLILGLGAGFKERDFREYGYELGTAAERVAGFAAATDRIDRRLHLLHPPPVRDIPILIGAGGPRMLGVVAERADIWHTFAEGEELDRKIGVLVEACARIGRPPEEIERSVLVGGAPDEVGEPLRRQGVTMFVLVASGPDFDLGPLRDWLAWRDDRNGGG